MKSLWKSHPDAVALAVLVAGLLIPAPGFARPKLQLTLASARQTNTIERLEMRGQKVWRRLEDRMRRIENRFEELAPPRVQRTSDEVDSE